MASSTTNRTNRNYALDCLRLVAVLLVLCRHQIGEPTDASAPLWETLRRGGWVGLDLFFVLSGYLVGGLLFQEHQLRGTLHWKRFLVRRGMKIYPTFYIWLGIFLIGRWVHGDLPPIRNILGEVFFLQNYLGGLRDHTWSLAVEEHFYLLLVATLVVLAGRGCGRPHAFKRVPVIVAGVGVLCLALRLATAGWVPGAGDLPNTWTHLRIDSLAFGVLLAHWRASRPVDVDGWVRPHRCGWVLFGLLCFVPAFVLPIETSWWIRTFGFTLNYLGAGALLMACVDLGAGDAPSRLCRAAAWLGAFSYPIYVWHMEVVLRVYAGLHLAAGWSVWSTAAISVIASLCVGVAFGCLVERPVLWWRDRFFPSRSGGDASARSGAESR